MVPKRGESIRNVKSTVEERWKRSSPVVIIREKKEEEEKEILMKEEKEARNSIQENIFVCLVRSFFLGFLHLTRRKKRKTFFCLKTKERSILKSFYRINIRFVFKRKIIFHDNIIENLFTIIIAFRFSFEFFR